MVMPIHQHNIHYPSPSEQRETNNGRCHIFNHSSSIGCKYVDDATGGSSQEEKNSKWRKSIKKEEVYV
jgi:hypothetical protein